MNDPKMQTWRDLTSKDFINVVEIGVLLLVIVGGAHLWKAEKTRVSNFFKTPVQYTVTTCNPDKTYCVSHVTTEPDFIPSGNQVTPLPPGATVDQEPAH